MASALGLVKFKDGSIRYFQYYATSDIIYPKLHETIDSVEDYWNEFVDIECTCMCEEEVYIFSSYAGGFYIKGFACKLCGAVRAETDNDGEFKIVERKDTYDWAKELGF